MTYQPKKASDFVGQKRHCILFGAPKVGKTVCAATMSESFPAALPATTKVFLQDMYWLQFDPDGLQSLISLNMDVAGADLSTCATKADVSKGLLQVIPEIKAGIAEGIIKTVVVDTISALDKVLLTSLQKEFDDPRSTGRMYNKLLQEHMNFAMWLKGFNCNLVVIAHAKVPMTALGDDEQLMLSRRGMQLPGDGKILTDITGAASRYWKGFASNVFAVVCNAMAGKKPTYKLLPNGGKGFEGGNRLYGLADEEEANLRKLFEKAERASVAVLETQNNKQ